MIKKRLLLLMLCCSTFCLTGCGEVIDLTEEETQLIAEYSAELLLKYDIHYVDRIDEGSKKEDAFSTEEEENAIGNELPMDTSENVGEDTTQILDESTSEEVTDGKATKEDNTTESEVTIGTEGNIAAIADVEGVEITYRTYSVVEQYPATDEEGEFIYLEASEGYQLLVVQFDVTNMTEEVVPVSLLDKMIDYRMECNGEISATPMLTILMDDLGTLETNVEPGTPQEAVLVFQVADGMQEQLETMELYITYNDEVNKITILQ